MKTPVVAGGGFLFERYGFLLSHSVQNTRPRGRDYVTVHSSTQAQVRLEINELNQAHWPSFARIVVERGTLTPGDELRLVIGDTSQGGPGSEVYDVTCQGRIVASMDRSGGLDYRQLSGGEIPVHVSSDPTPTLLRLLGPSIARPGEPFAPAPGRLRPKPQRLHAVHGHRGTECGGVAAETGSRAKSVWDRRTLASPSSRG